MLTDISAKYPLSILLFYLQTLQYSDIFFWPHPPDSDFPSSQQHTHRLQTPGHRCPRYHSDTGADTPPRTSPGDSFWSSPLQSSPPNTCTLQSHGYIQHHCFHSYTPPDIPGRRIPGDRVYHSAYPASLRCRCTLPLCDHMMPHYHSDTSLYILLHTYQLHILNNAQINHVTLPLSILNIIDNVIMFSLSLMHFKNDNNN